MVSHSEHHPASSGAHSDNCFDGASAHRRKRKLIRSLFGSMETVRYHDVRVADLKLRQLGERKDWLAARSHHMGSAAGAYRAAKSRNIRA
jgi:hypothetical protein